MVGEVGEVPPAGADGGRGFAAVAWAGGTEAVVVDMRSAGRSKISIDSLMHLHRRGEGDFERPAAMGRLWDGRLQCVKPIRFSRVLGLLMVSLSLRVQ